MYWFLIGLILTACWFCQILTKYINIQNLVTNVCSTYSWKNIFLQRSFSIFSGPVKVVRLGVTNLTDLTYVKDIEVLETFEHPLYSHEKYHDIALLKINSSSLQFHPALRPACLYTSQDIQHEKAIATGFGATNKDGDSSSYLLRVVLDFFDVDQCNETYLALIKTPGSTLRMGITGESMVCAGSRTEFRDTCEVWFSFWFET